MASKKFETLDGLSSTGDVIITGNVAVDTDTLYVDSVNNRVGLGKTNPSTLLDVDGNITATNVNATFHGDGSNVTSVNATALGGLSNAQFLRSDTSDSFTSGTLTLSGSAVSITAGNLRLANNIPLRIGTSDSPGGSIQFNPTGNTVQINGSNVNFDTATLFVDTTNNRVGVGKTNPATALDVNGTVTATAFTGDSTIVRTSRNINTSGIATGGGNLSADRTINVPATNLGTSANTTTRTVTSSTGTNVVLPTANSTQAGVMSSADRTKLDGIEDGAEVNVATDLGNVANSTALQVTSSTGTDTNLPAASGSAWGVVTTGSQTFGGTKTFSSTIAGSINGNANTATTANALNTSNNYQVNSLGVGTAASGTAGDIQATGDITAKRLCVGNTHCSGLGTDSSILNGSGNKVADNDSIVGGKGNLITSCGGTGNRNVIAGGGFNCICDPIFDNRISGATISGGDFNFVRSSYTTISGGTSNLANTAYATVSGGVDNCASGFGSSIPGGICNYADGGRAHILGGENNVAGCFYSAAGTCGISTTAQCQLRVRNLSKVSGTFTIDHPDPAKNHTHYLNHSFVESPTAGDNIYRFTVTVVNGEAILDLPDYYRFLNTDDQLWVNPQGHFGVAYAEVNEDQTQLTVYADQDGDYNILLIGTRKDPEAVHHWHGVETYK